MKEFFLLLSPVFLSLKNDLLRFNRAFYRKVVFYAFFSLGFIFLLTKALTTGMEKLQNLSSEVFNILVIKGYALIFLIIALMQVINGLVMSFNKYYQSQELELLFTSPVNRTSLFYSRLFETHLKTSWMFIVFGIPLLAALGLHFGADPFYYLCALIALVSFSIIPVNVGIAMTIVLAGIFHLKRLKKFLFFGGVVSVVGLITLLRMIRPERFVNPALFANLKIFLSELESPSYILLPNRWISESLFSSLEAAYRDTFLFLALLVLTAYVTVLFLFAVFRKLHYRGWSLLQGETISPRRKGKSGFAAALLRPVSSVLSVVDRQGSALFRKDLFYQFHDIRNIQQNLILFSLIVVYLFSIASLPMNWEQYGVQLKYMISFFNLGLILIIIASLCSKLVYPAIVSEGSSLWIIKTAPLKATKYIWIKSLFLFIPIFLLAQVLIVFSSYFVNVEQGVFALNILTTTLVCCSLVSMAVSFSISDLRNVYRGSGRGDIKTGNILYMILSVLLVLFVLLLEVIPLYLYFMKEKGKGIFTERAWLFMGVLLFILISVNILITAVAMRSSMKKFESIQAS